MQQLPNAKQFAEHLNKVLDDLEVPEEIRERSTILAKMLHISKHQALSLLEGHQVPDDTLLKAIANELEVDPVWLLSDD